MITLSLQEKAKDYLIQHDPMLANVISQVPDITWEFDRPYFVALVDAIVGQQLSIKAADTIFARVAALCGERGITSQAIESLEPQQLREAGLSWSKIAYVKDLAAKELASGILFEQFDIMTDEEIIQELIKVKGIGRWTAEMFLIFAMGREDVFSYGDLGIRKAIQKMYGLKKEPTQEQAERIAAKWKPYRSLACRYLWKSLALTP